MFILLLSSPCSMLLLMLYLTSLLTGSVQLKRGHTAVTYRNAVFFNQCSAERNGSIGVPPIANKKIKIRPKLLWGHLAVPAHEFIFDFGYNYSVTHTHVSIGCFSCKLLSTEKCCFCPFGMNKQTLMSLRGFCEQSKRSKGFHSYKKVEKHCHNG